MLVRLVLEAAAGLGAEVDRLDLSSALLPAVADPGVPVAAVPADDPAAALRKRTAQADVLLLATPVHHGSFSGLLKQWIDLHRDEFAGKLGAIAVSTSRGLATGCVQHLTSVLHSMHAWVLPYAVVCGSASPGSEAGPDDELVRRAARMAEDLVAYGPLLGGRFAADLEAGGRGFAGRHLRLVRPLPEGEAGG